MVILIVWSIRTNYTLPNIIWIQMLPIGQSIRAVSLSSTNYIESKSWFDLVAISKHSDDFTNNKHCVNQGMAINVKLWQLSIKYKQSVNKSCLEDEFIDGSMFYHTIQQLNICIINMIWEIVWSMKIITKIYQDILCYTITERGL